MVHSILVVCMGNICRSPVAAKMLSHCLPTTTIRSAGLIARQGMPADKTMTTLALQDGITLAEHRAQRFSLSLASQHELILVMERQQLTYLHQCYPQISGKSFLFSHWNGRADIPDPYKKSNEDYRVVYQKLFEHSQHWKTVLYP